MVESSAGPGFWHEKTGISPAQAKAWLVFVNPFSLNVEHWLKQWNEAYANIPIFGGLAGGAPGEPEAWVFHNDRSISGGVALALEGDIAVHSVVSQGCKPIGEPLTVTQAERNVLLTARVASRLRRAERRLQGPHRSGARTGQGPSFRGYRGQRISRGIQAGRFSRAQHHRGRSEQRRGGDQRRSARGPDPAIPVARFARGERRAQAAAHARNRSLTRSIPTPGCSAPATGGDAGSSAIPITMPGS